MSTESMTKTFTVRFDSTALDSPEYVGPFYSEEEAQDYADDRNSSLALSGIPSSIAFYTVV
jgi:carbamate kinase